MIHNPDNLSDTELFAWLTENTCSLMYDVDIMGYQYPITNPKSKTGWRLTDSQVAEAKPTPQEAIRDAVRRRRDQIYKTAYDWFTEQHGVLVVTDSDGFTVECGTENIGGKGDTLNKAIYNLWGKTNEIKSEGSTGSGK